MPGKYEGVCSLDGLRLTFAFEFDFAGDGELCPLNRPVLPLFRVFWLERLVLLFERLPALPFGVFAGVEGAEVRT